MIPHPARYSDPLLPVLAECVPPDALRIIDPMAGTCRIAELRAHGVTAEIHANELEPEWGLQGLGRVDRLVIGDARRLPYPDGHFDAVITSPTYGNRMADHANWAPGRKHVTYKGHLGRSLTPGNSGRLQWGDAYRTFHLEAFAEFVRVAPLVVINASNHVRKGVEQGVCEWMIWAFTRVMRFEHARTIEVPTRRMRFGANHDARTSAELVMVFRRPRPRGGLAVTA